MDFWAHQESARQRSGWLIALYIFLVMLFSLPCALIVNVYLLSVFSYDMFYSESVTLLSRSGFDIFLAAGYSFTTLRFWLIFLCFPVMFGVLALFSPARLSAGGRSVAEAMDGSLVIPQTTREAERRLLNVVEEMALASGMPVPPVYVLKNEEGINAFVAGSTVNDAVLGVTKGALLHLDRSELQAVIAHEFSHIHNGDMRLNLRFAQLLFGFVCLSEIGKVILRNMGWSSGRSGNDSSGGYIKALILCIGIFCDMLGWIMAAMSSVMQAAINRQREFLADAFSVQATRSNALASVLKKIGGLQKGSAITESALVSNFSHLFFCRTEGGFLSTHPPLSVRIRRLDLEWDGSFPAVLPKAEEQEEDEKHTRPVRKGPPGYFASPKYTPPPAPRSATQSAITGRGAHSSGCAATGGNTPGALPKYSPLGYALATPAQQGAAVSDMVRAPLAAADAEHAAPASALVTAHGDSFGESSALLSSKPGEAEKALQKLYAACHEPLDACYLVFALLLDTRQDVRARQLAPTKNEQRRADILEYRRVLDFIAPEDILPLIESAIPALKMLSSRQYDVFHRAMLHYINADNEFSFREWIFYELIIGQVGAQYERPACKTDVQEASVALLAALALLEPDPEAARRAFAAAMEQLHYPVRVLPQAPAPEDLSRSMCALRKSPEASRDAFMRAALALATYDKRLTRDEAMFLRLTSICLERPFPETAYAQLLQQCS